MASLQPKDEHKDRFTGMAKGQEWKEKQDTTKLKQKVAGADDARKNEAIEKIKEYLEGAVEYLKKGRAADFK